MALSLRSSLIVLAVPTLTCIQGMACLPDPILPPTPNQKGRITCWTRPPLRPRTTWAAGSYCSTRNQGVTHPTPKVHTPSCQCRIQGSCPLPVLGQPGHPAVVTSWAEFTATFTSFRGGGVVTCLGGSLVISCSSYITYSCFSYITCSCYSYITCSCYSYITCSCYLSY